MQPVLPLNCGSPSALAPQPRDWDLLLTAETHNFPCAVAPYPGAHTPRSPLPSASRPLSIGLLACIACEMSQLGPSKALRRQLQSESKGCAGECKDVHDIPLHGIAWTAHVCT